MYPSVHNVNSAPKPLETEATDARLRKHKEDPEILDQDKGQQNKDRSFQDLEKEANVFSLNALIMFLEDFLEARLSSRLNEYQPSPQVSTISPWLNRDISNSNDMPSVLPNRAARAYAHGANAIKGVIRQTPIQAANESKVNDVYHLLRDLRDLRDAGKKNLRLEQGDTFFEGISKAVQIAKQDLI